MPYWHGEVAIVSRSMIYRNIPKLLYYQLFKEVCQRLQLHSSEGAQINLTCDAWSALNNIPFLAITAHSMNIDFKLVSTPIGFE